jgi:hypothetical protein
MTYEPSPVSPGDRQRFPVSIYTEDYPGRDSGHCVYSDLEVIHDNADKVPVPRPNEGAQVSVDRAGAAYVTPQDATDRAPYEGWEKMLVEPPTEIKDDESPAEQDEPAGKRQLRRRKRCLALLALLLVAIIVAAAVGGVLGSRSGKSSAAPDDASLDRGDSASSSNSNSLASATSSEAGTPTESSAASETSEPISSSAPSSAPGPATTPVPLAAAVWPDFEADALTIYLGYQSSEGELKLTKRVISGPKDEGSPWSDPERFQPRRSAESAGSLALNLFDEGDTLQLQMMYIDSDTNIKGVTMNVETGEFEQIKKEQFSQGERKASSESNMAAIGGWFFYQDKDDSIQSLWWDNGNSKWEAYDLDQKALPGSHLAAVQLTANSKEVNEMGKLALITQDSNDNLLPSPNPTKGTNPKKEGEKDFDPIKSLESWPGLFPGTINLDPGAGFAGFSIPRRIDGKSLEVDTYMLYQDGSSNIKQLATVKGGDWSISSPPALLGADEMTPIACVGMPGWNEEDPKFQFLMSEDTRRCYFLKKGVIFEVQLNGTEWVELGNVVAP